MQRKNEVSMVDQTANYRWKLLDAPDPETLVVVDAAAPTRSDLDEFVAGYIEHLSKQPMVQSVYHYSGAYSKADFIPGLSDADFLVVVDDDAPSSLAILDPKNVPCSGMSQAALSLMQHPPLVIPRSQLGNVYRYALDGPPRAEHLVYGALQELPQCSLPALTVQAYWHALGLLSRLVWALLGGRLQISSLYRLAKGATFVARKVLEIERVPLLERYLSEVERLKASFPVDAPQLAAHPLLEIAVNAWSVWLSLLQALQAACLPQASPEAHHQTFAIRTLYKSYAVFLDLGQDLDLQQDSGDRLSIEDVLERHSVTSWEFGVSFVRLLLPWELSLLARMEASAVAAYDPGYAGSAVVGELGDEATYPGEIFQVVRARLRTFLEHRAFCRAHGLRQHRLPYFAHVGDNLLPRVDDGHLGLVRDFRTLIAS